MKKLNYIAPEVSSISVEIENGIAQSAAPLGYGAPGTAGAAGDESGITNW